MDAFGRTTGPPVREHASVAVKGLDGIALGAHHEAESGEINRQEAHSEEFERMISKLTMPVFWSCISRSELGST
jgi:hypothetical protein